MKKIFRIIISISLFCIALIGVLFLVWPSYEEFSTLRSQVQETKNRLEHGERILAQLKKVEEEVSAHQEDFAKIQEAIPEDAGLPVLYDHIKELGTGSGLILQSIEGQIKEDAESALKKIAFKVEFLGSYEGLKNFLDETRRSARIFNISAITVSAGSEDPGVLQITMELLAYENP